MIKKGKIKLRPRARIIKTIGEELISSDPVAIIELVKNSYDADATKVTINFVGPLKMNTSKIIIADNGHGMTFDSLKNGWMEPASIIKTKKRKSKKGRPLLGEKGIGRFASAKLSKKLTLTTLSKKADEIKASFDWKIFSNEKYLDELDCEWEIRPPKEITNQGTILCLEKLNTTWDLKKINELKIALSRLINPISPIKDFEINLEFDSAEFKDKSGIISPPKSLAKPNYLIKGIVDINGKADIIYFSKNANAEKNIKLKIKNSDDVTPTCGPFKFEFRVWDRDTELLKNLAKDIGSTITDIRRDLNSASGISIFRDNFRVFPYGEQDNDWLRLDLRRVQNPTLRVSNNQIIGQVSINLKDNPELKDQSNRQGIVETQEFEDLRECVKQILSELEQLRYKERREEKIKPLENKGIFESITLSPVVELIKKKLPDDIEANELIAQTEKELNNSIKQVQDVLARYRRLSTLGLLVDVVLHEGNQYLNRIDNNVSLLERKINKKSDTKSLLSHVESIKYQKRLLTELFKRLEPFGGRRKEKAKEIIVEDLIKNVFDLFNNEITKNKINVNLPKGKTSIVSSESDLSSIFVNLLDNSLFWLSKSEKKNKEINVIIINNESDLLIEFNDNGPGIKDEDIPYIFDPYFSTKPNGIGLGLTIVGELIREMDGQFDLISKNNSNGTQFRISFNK